MKKLLFTAFFISSSLWANCFKVFNETGNKLDVELLYADSKNNIKFLLQPYSPFIEVKEQIEKILMGEPTDFYDTCSQEAKNTKGILIGIKINGIEFAIDSAQQIKGNGGIVIKGKRVKLADDKKTANVSLCLNFIPQRGDKDFKNKFYIYVDTFNEKVPVAKLHTPDYRVEEAGSNLC